MRRTWRVDIVVGWALLMAALILVGIVGLIIWLWPRPPAIDPARIYRACEQYANLDLSGWASICSDVGYQQAAYHQPLGNPPYWPTVYRPIQPEDLDR